MKTKNLFLFFTFFILLFSFFITACDFEYDTRPDPATAEFIPVEEITGIPTGSLPFVDINLRGTVIPQNATNKRIVWSIKSEGGTGAALNRNTLATEDYGTVTVTATIANGLAAGVDYAQDFDILIAANMTAVSSITGIPDTVDIGSYTLRGKVNPSVAINKTIEWSVKDAGATGAVINGNTLTTTAPGTLVIRAVVQNGLLNGDYIEDFTIEVLRPAVESITGIPSKVLMGSYALDGVVVPSYAVNTVITWSVKSAGATGAVINGSTLTTTAQGTVTVTATIAGGLITADYTQDFEIEIVDSSIWINVSSISGIPAALRAGSHVLNGVVEPSNATNKNIAWSVTDAGTTGAAIHGDTLTTTAQGTVVITATVADGTLTETSITDYTQNFSIAVSALTHITANYTGASVYTGTSLDVLKANLTVTAHYSDGSSETVDAADYTLSGELAVVGASVVNVSYTDVVNKTTSFNVTVTERPPITIANITDWNNAISHISTEGAGNYTFNISGSISGLGTGTSTALTFGDVSPLTLTLRGSGTMSVANNSTGYLLNVGANQTVIIDSENLTLQGRTGNGYSLANVGGTGARLELRAGTINGNTMTSSGVGGGVRVANNGTFVMSGGEISGNSANDAGGVAVYGVGSDTWVTGDGTFIMSGGTITKNTCNASGGGVMNYGGIFDMTGGTISGNSVSNSGSRGGGIANWGIFRMSGGTVYGSNESDTSLRNTANNGAALQYGNPGTVSEYGTFTGTTWNKAGDLETTDDTIRVVNGQLQQ